MGLEPTETFLESQAKVAIYNVLRVRLHEMMQPVTPAFLLDNPPH